PRGSASINCAARSRAARTLVPKLQLGNAHVCEAPASSVTAYPWTPPPCEAGASPPRAFPSWSLGTRQILSKARGRFRRKRQRRFIIQPRVGAQRLPWEYANQRPTLKGLYRLADHLDATPSETSAKGGSFVRTWESRVGFRRLRRV